eukprot:Trichotokara_eunicae@DN6724_c0_g1_i1.p1
MREVNKCFGLSVAKYGDDEIGSDLDELEIAAERFVFEREIRNMTSRRELARDRAKLAGVGFGGAASLAPGMDDVTGGDVANVFARSSAADN